MAPYTTMEHRVVSQTGSVHVTSDVLLHDEGHNLRGILKYRHEAVVHWHYSLLRRKDAIDTPFSKIRLE